MLPPRSFNSASSQLFFSDLGSNVVSELLRLYSRGRAGVIGVFLRLYQGRGDGF